VVRYTARVSERRIMQRGPCLIGAAEYSDNYCDRRL